MGRSEKKIKSERVNALRKRYEAFLEEDKKRKERNDYILGKLDKMRLWNGVVAQKYQPDYPEVVETQTQSRVATFPHDRISGYSRSPKPSMEVSLRNPNEFTLLREIMNKFILIPKRDIIEDTAVREYLPDERTKYNNNDENGDWKSKYEILNQLKINEKDSSRGIATQVDKFSTLPTKENDDKYDIPEKDVPHANIEYPLDKNWQSQNETEQVNFHKNQYTPTVDKVGLNLQQINGNVNAVTSQPMNLETEIKPNTTFEHLSVDYQEPTPQNTEIRNDENSVDKLPKTADIEKVADVDYLSPTEDYSNVPVAAPAVINDNTVRPVVDTQEVEYPIDVINVADFTPNDDVILQEGYNINPEGFGLNQTHFDNLSTHTAQMSSAAISQNNPEVETEEHNEELETETSNLEPEAAPEMTPEELMAYQTHSEEIEAFETEQNEMFYQEAPPENVPLDAQGEMYDQQSESYNQQDQQHYYESPHDQAHPAEINAKEEVIQQYDQTYAEQYVDTPKVTYDVQQFAQDQEYNPQSQEYAQQHGYGEQEQVYGEQQQVYSEQQAYGDQQQTYADQQQAYDQQQPVYGEQQQEYGDQQHQEYPQQQVEYTQQQGELSQQYDQQVVYDEQQGYEQQPPKETYEPYTQEVYKDYEHQQETNDVQQISQQLDNEQGYAVNQS